jgi:Ca-activated chloride channel family protein
MSFATPLALFALLALPAIVLLHMFRRVLRQRPVAALFLWAPEALRASSGRRRTRLLRSASLLLELLAALGLALWLAGPRLGLSGASVHVVVVLDDSASLAARPPGGGGPPVAELVRRDVRALLGELPRSARASVVLTGPRPRVLVGPRAQRLEAEAALESFEPTAPAHDLLPGVDLARALCSDGDRIVVWTDGLTRVDETAVDAGMATRWEGVEVRAFGEARANAAITSARRLAAQDGAAGERVFVDVRAWGARLGGADARLEVLVDEDPSPEPAASYRFTLGGDGGAAEAGSVQRLDVPLPDGLADRSLRVRLVAPDDALPVDDEAVLLPRLDRTIALATTLPTEQAERLQLPRIARSLEGCVAVEDPARADLRIGPASAGSPAGQSALVFSTPDGPKDPWVGPYLFDRRSEVVEGLTLDGVVWSAGRGEVAGRPVVQAGEQALVGVEEDLRTGALIVHANLDLDATNLTRSPDWPILLDNLARAVRSRMPGPVDSEPAVGGEIVWRPRAEDRGRAVELVDPDGSVRRRIAHGPAAAGRGVSETACAWPAERAGLHRLLVGGEERARFAVRFVDPVESDLRGRGSGRRSFATSDRDGLEVDQGLGLDEPGTLERLLLALFVLVCLVLDWWVLRRAS